MLVIVVKGFFKSPNLHSLIKQSLSPVKNQVLVAFVEQLIVLPTTVSYLLYLFYIIHPATPVLYLLYLMRCFLHPLSCKAKLFVEIFSRNFCLTLVSLYLGFPSRTNLKLNNIPITPKLVQKVITDLDSLILY